MPQGGHRLIGSQRVAGRRRGWWLQHRPRPKIWQALDGLSRYNVTQRVAKHRLFAWLDVRVSPSCQLIVVARDDDATFGIVHSRFHEVWSLRMGTWLGKGKDPRRTPTTTVETIPFPEELSSDLLASDHLTDLRARAIASAAQRLVASVTVGSPPEWVEEPVAGYPRRPVPCDRDAVKEPNKRTLTNLYNARTQWLAGAHGWLAAAVAAAYRWPADVTDDAALAHLLRRNRLDST